MHNRQQRGFSLVEIMVAMVIALLGTVVIFQVFEVSESIKRTSTSGGDAQQFGAIALFTLERDLRMSGYGVNNANLISCPTNYRDTAPPHSDLDDVSPSTTLPNSGSLSLVPVEIVAGANASTSDEIRIFYGNSQLLSTPAKITANQSAPFNEVRLANPFGFVPGNAIVIQEPPPKNCTMGQVTEVVSESAFYRTGNYLNAGGISVAARFNGAAGPAGGYTTNGIVFNLGNAPVRNVYRIKGNQLVLQSMFGTSGSIAVADNILLLKAQYGKDTNGDGSVDPPYDNTTPANPTEWSRVLTVRLAVIARSAQPEIASSGNKADACDATIEKPRYFVTLNDYEEFTPPDPGDPDTWKCYRYRVFETTVPLRNLLWQQL